MNKKLNIGDYVRTKCGAIGKIIRFSPGFSFKVKTGKENADDIVRREILITVDTNYNFSDEKDTYSNDDIIKSSPNIIDLIEVGDVIVCDNKKYAINYEFEVDYNNDYKDYEITIDDYITLFLKDGLSIVTKEQFESMEYKLEENNE